MSTSTKYDQLTGALMRAATITELTELQTLCGSAFAQGEISATQLALLRRSAQNREQTIVDLVLA
jgi:hypothetical protein